MRLKQVFFFLTNFKKFFDFFFLKKKLKEDKDIVSLSNLLSDGPIRMITQGQELTTELDEKTLQEMMFKDSQVKNFKIPS